MPGHDGQTGFNRFGDKSLLMTVLRLAGKSLPGDCQAPGRGDGEGARHDVACYLPVTDANGFCSRIDNATRLDLRKRQVRAAMGATLSQANAEVRQPRCGGVA